MTYDPKVRKLRRLISKASNGSALAAAEPGALHPRTAEPQSASVTQSGASELRTPLRGSQAGYGRGRSRHVLKTGD